MISKSVVIILIIFGTIAYHREFTKRLHFLPFISEQLLNNNSTEQEKYRCISSKRILSMIGVYLALLRLGS